MKLSKQALIALGITSAGLLGCVTTEMPSDGALTRTQLDKMLNELAKKKVSRQEIISACCYMTMPSPERIDYLCPLCKTKTHHAKQYSVACAESVDWYRQQIKDIKELGLDIALDETDLCSQCRRDKTTNTINFYIIVWVDNRAMRTQLEYDDFEKIIAFLKKENTYSFEERPLKDALPRIRKILGMDGGGTTPKPGGLKK